jgi:hypothetical protein
MMQTTNAEWIDALAKLRTLTRIDEIAENLEVDLDLLETTLAKDRNATLSFQDLFGGGEWTASTPGQWLIGALLAVRTRSFAKNNETHEGNLELTQKRVVVGDLHVKGNLELKSDLFVLGDVVIDGYSRDTSMDISHFVVAGNVTCKKGLFSEGFLGVGGRASAPIIALTFNQGFAKILNGVAAKALVECDHGGSRIFGGVDAGIVIYDELQCDKEPKNGDIEQLAKALTPAAREAIDGQEAMDAVTTLADRLAAGEAIFTS